jgi:hypothetical protein
MPDTQTAPDTTTANALRGPWTAVLSTRGDIVDDLTELLPDAEVDISIRRGSARPDDDGYLSGTCYSGDVIRLWENLYVEDGDPSTDAAARWVQAQAMAAGLNAGQGQTDTDLITPTLGEKPFILIEATEDPNADTGFDLAVRAGGGVSSHEELVVMLLLVAEKITGVDTDLYVKEVDMVRRAAGKPGLRTASREG